MKIVYESKSQIPRVDKFEEIIYFETWRIHNFNDKQRVNLHENQSCSKQNSSVELQAATNAKQQKESYVNYSCSNKIFKRHCFGINK